MKKDCTNCLAIHQATQGERFDTLLTLYFPNLESSREYQKAFDAIKKANIVLLDTPVFKGGELVKIPRVKFDSTKEVAEPWSE